MFAWLDKADKTVSWLVRELKAQYGISYSRASLQFAIAGHRPEKDQRYSKAYVPHHIIWAIKQLSEGAVTEASWTHVRPGYSDDAAAREITVAPRSALP